jgi:hypothetical protein
VVPAKIHGPGVPARLGGGIEPRPQVPGAAIHAVDEEKRVGLERPRGGGMLEEEVADALHGAYRTSAMTAHFIVGGVRRLNHVSGKSPADLSHRC